MPFSRPSLPALINQVRADMLQRLGLDEPLRRADAEVFSRVLAAGVHGLYGHLEFLSRQVMPDTAESEYLDRHAATWLPEGRKPASAATGSVTFTVLPGAVIPAGTQLQSLDGVAYATTADATGTAPTYTAPVQAVAPAEASNRPTGQALSLVSPVAGVQPTATAGALSGGSDVESDDALRDRLLARIRRPPQGGTNDDYIGWTLEVAGVTRAWCTQLAPGSAEVIVRFVRDADVSGLIPDSGEIATVQAYLDARRPVTAQVTVLAPVAAPINFTVDDLLPDTPSVRAAIEAELAALITREAVPGGTIYISHIRAAISAAAGENDYTLITPTANVVASSGHIHTMGAVTWP